MKRPSFQFYPGDWSGSRWIYYDMNLNSNIAALPGCYVIYIDNKVAYVGSSINVRRRVNSHIQTSRYSATLKTPWGVYIDNQISIKVHYILRYGDWTMRELRLINRLKPLFNVLSNKS